MTIILTAKQREINRQKRLQAEAEATKSAQILKGENGLSAYELAVKHGFVGTEVEWMNSLKATNQVNLSMVVVEPLEHNVITNTLSMKVLNGGSF